MAKLTQYRLIIHWGTSTRTYPEWQGTVHHKRSTTNSIETELLAGFEF
ncbi:hypothetical protein HUU05_16090 [candidate division KSB1 bacterium]|nr:hypothetical protein [candidate division KSB1 bacterium]